MSAPLSPLAPLRTGVEARSLSVMSESTQSAPTSRSRTESVVSVTVPTATVVYRDGVSEYVRYRVECTWGSMRWSTDRRYSEFRQFHRVLASATCTARSRCGFHRAPALPPRMVTQRGNHNPLNIHERRMALQAYLGSLSGLCRRHQTEVESFLHGSSDSPAFAPAETPFRQWTVQLPNSMSLYCDLELKFFDRCHCVIRRGASATSPACMDLKVACTQPDDFLHQRAPTPQLSGEADLFCHLISRLVTPTSFPSVDDVRTFLATVRKRSTDAEISRGPFSTQPRRGRAAEPVRTSHTRAYTQPPKGRHPAAWERRKDSAGSMHSGHDDDACAHSSIDIKRTISWMDMCNAKPPDHFLLSGSPAGPSRRGQVRRRGSHSGVEMKSFALRTSASRQDTA
eukprot:TRINITY_DN1900_c0_g5_i1.p1 TRINITY_DN1900_c0_g5~~TRINITY_DN1900_c0_g5_i1.p1  ORF type:complete len:398 (+),score=74.75 TRINITY_DN1900_c0_g5_i1:1000-2193(+)